MKIINYSSEAGYYAQQVKIKELISELLCEAIANRQESGRIVIDEFALYGEIMNKAQDNVEYAKKELAEHTDKEDNAEGGKE